MLFAVADRAKGGLTAQKRGHLTSITHISDCWQAEYLGRCPNNIRISPSPTTADVVPNLVFQLPAATNHNILLISFTNCFIIHKLWTVWDFTSFGVDKLDYASFVRAYHTGCLWKNPKFQSLIFQRRAFSFPMLYTWFLDKNKCLGHSNGFGIYLVSCVYYVSVPRFN